VSDVPTAPEATVVIPTRARPETLGACLDALLAQETARPFEIVVVDDNDVPLRLDPEHADRVRLVVSGGRGPAVARNVGVRAAASPVILFTDDDTLPVPGWVESAVAALAAAPDAIGVEGPIESVPWDVLYERSVRSGPNSRFTGNVGYRRADLLAEGGFDEAFRLPGVEDVELGLRMVARGPVLYVPEMGVEHRPRRLSARQMVARGRSVVNDVRLYRKHPSWSHRGRGPRRSALIERAAEWYRLLRNPAVTHRSPRRVARLLALAGGELAVAAFALLRHRDAVRP
jgi:glycosyltransferase involved in cell wall biosynthesis